MLISLLPSLTALTRQACRLVMAAYTSDIKVTRKPNGSLVTDTDQQSEALIESGLRQMTPNILVVGEEAAALGRAYPKAREFWLVDPLDATGEFINKRGAFSINIALVRDASPVLGAIGHPLENTVYIGGPGLGLWESVGDRPLIPLQRQDPVQEPFLRGIRSSAKLPAELLTAFFKDMPVKWTHLSSALKFIQLAKGLADLYPRAEGIMEWDTAAGQAILGAVGGNIFTSDRQPLTYGKPDFANPPFVALSPEGIQRMTMDGAR